MVIHSGKTIPLEMKMIIFSLTICNNILWIFIATFQFNTYQLVLAMDDNNGLSDAFFLYKRGSMHWSPHYPWFNFPRNNWIGIAAPAKKYVEVYNAPQAGRRTAFRMDEIIGNTGFLIFVSII